MSHVTDHVTGELVAGIPNNELPVLETTREELEAINHTQAGIDQALAVAVGSMNNNVSDNSMSHIVNSVADVSKSSGKLVTQPSISVSNWTESKFSETIDHQSEISDMDKEYNIKDEIPSSDDDFGGDTDCDEDLSYLDLNNTIESMQGLLTADKPKQPADKPKQPADKPKQPVGKPKQPADKPKQPADKPKQTADKPKGNESKKGRKGKGKVKEEMVEPVPLPSDTSKELVSTSLNEPHDKQTCL